MRWTGRSWTQTVGPLLTFTGLAVFALLPLGCADDVAPPADAALDTRDAATDDGGVVLVDPEPPAAPSSPDFGTCPAGWDSVERAGARYCEPWGDAGPGCTAGEVRFPGDDACHPLGEACPTGPFPSDVVGSAIFVLEGATGGDGTIGAPFGSLAEAIAAATSGDTIVLSTGTHAGDVALPDGVSLQGACAEGTVVEGSAGALSTSTLRAGEGSTIRDLGVRGLRPGIRVEDVSATIRDVRIEASLLGLSVLGAATLDADGLVVSATAGAPGAGMFMFRGSSATITRAFFADNTQFGIGMGDSGTTLTLARSVVMRTQPAADLQLGVGVAASGGATLIVAETEVRENHSAGINVQQGAAATLRHAVLRANLSSAFDGRLGLGLIAQQGAGLSAETSVFQGNFGGGFVAEGLRTEVDGRDLFVLDSFTATEATQAGIGVVVAEGAVVDLERVLVDGAEGLGMSITGLDSHLAARDLTVRAIAPRPSDDAAGRGIDVERGATADLTRLAIEDVYGSALLAADPDSAAVLNDVSLRDVRSDARTRTSGRGITLQFGGCVEATRVSIARVRDVGILAYGEDVEMRATELAIDGTLPRECAADTCADFQSGNGITASDGAIVDLARFRIADSTLAGLQVARGARITAAEGLVSGNAVGVNAQTEDFDPADVSMGVQFVDNGINFDGTALPIPQPGAR